MGRHSPDRFAGIARPSSLELDHIALSEGIIGRLKWDEDVGGVPVQMEQTGGYMVCYQRKYLPVRQEWVDGRKLDNAPIHPGQFMLLDLRRNYRAISPLSVDCLSVFTSESALLELHQEHHRSAFAGLRVALGATYADPIIAHLMECLGPAFDTRRTVSRLFLDQVMLTLLIHLGSAHAERPLQLRAVTGSLAPWQERRVKEILLANLSGEISIEQLASECGLSRAHFARSFKASTGRSPMKWLLEQRIEKARGLLVRTSLPLAEIAYNCGFVDHSHLSKVFFRYHQVMPGEWRRRQKF